MKRICLLPMVFGLILFGMQICVYGEQIVPGNTRVEVKYQAKSRNSSTWATYSTGLTGVTTESMMENTLSARHSGADVRILAVSVSGQSKRVNVRYQTRRGNSAWNTGSTTLFGALTESMAKNQLSAQYPDMEVRILSMQ